MKKLFLFSIFLWAIFFLNPSNCWAQPQPPVAPGVARPTFSPYLNLLRGGNSPALNYYGITRPQLQLNRQFNQLNQQLQSYNQDLGQLVDSGFGMGINPLLPFTGQRAATFNNTMGYFDSFGTSRSGLGGRLGGSGFGSLTSGLGSGAFGGVGTGFNGLGAFSRPGNYSGNSMGFFGNPTLGRPAFSQPVTPNRR